MKTYHHTFMKRISFTIVGVLYASILVSPTALLGAQTVTPPSDPIPPTTTTETTQVLPPEEVKVPPPAYVYNKVTGQWENGTYSWDPVTNQTTPLKATTYSYNPVTGAWDSDGWRYDAGTGTYVPNVPIATISNTGPDSTNTITDPTSPASISNTGPSSTNKTDGGAVSNTGPDSTNAIDHSGDSDLFFGKFFNATISGTINSQATSGNASVLNNTFGGSATSGNALTQAALLNMIQSSWGGGSGTSPNLYTTTIQGGHVGDLMVDPNMLLKVAPQLQPKDSSLEVVIAENVSINNELNLGATSGSATVANNTNAGDATTGDAYVLANVMNLINSSIAANQSFIGIINVLGDLEGDILVPNSVSNALLAANVPTSQISIGGPRSLSVDLDTTYAIDNNINATATSGGATVANNTNAGDATSGSAETSVTVFNMTGQQVLAENAMLIFVNVLGEWIGFITNAPAGSSAALLGNGTSSLLPPHGSDASYDIDRNYSITNNIDAAAASGNATVESNTNAGNATSGNAYTAVNTLNAINSNFTLSGWYGVLFINIFGNWNGSYGTDTAYGGYSTRTPAIGGNPASNSNSGSSAPSATATTGNVSPVLAAVVVMGRSKDNDSFRYVGGFGSSTPTPPAAAAAAESVLGATETKAESAAPVGITESSIISSWYFIGAVLIGSVLFWQFFINYRDGTLQLRWK